jgi:AraC-like DNA-binding protein
MSGRPSVLAWHSAVGLFERYSYPPGPAGRGEPHVHADIQICLSENFPGRYRSGHFSVAVPAGSVSVVDAWEPHATEDPCDRGVTSLYRVLYVSKTYWDDAADESRWDPRFGLLVTSRPEVMSAVAALHQCTETLAGRLEQEERLAAVVMSLSRNQRRRGGSQPNRRALDVVRLERAREYIRANAIDGVTLASAAREAGLSPQHFAASFRVRFGVPAHRFQTAMRLDRARHLLARGVPLAEVATASGFVDQSHLTRHFKQYLHMTPGQYRARTNPPSA